MNQLQEDARYFEEQARKSRRMAGVMSTTATLLLCGIFAILALWAYHPTLLDSYFSELTGKEYQVLTRGEAACERELQEKYEVEDTINMLTNSYLHHHDYEITRETATLMAVKAEGICKDKTRVPEIAEQIFSIEAVPTLARAQWGRCGKRIVAELASFKEWCPNIEKRVARLHAEREKEERRTLGQLGR